MKIESIKIESLEIPFKVSFKHASAVRKTTQSILVIAQSDQTIGFGEGCPREYVTNESIESCLTFFSDHKNEFLKITSYSDLQQWINQNEALIDKNPAAWCAVEIAILDLLAKCQKQSIESILNLPKLEGNFQYSAIIGDSNLDKTIKQVKQFNALGFTDFKVKITGDPTVDNKKLAVISECIKNDLRLRLDANNLWSKPKMVLKYLNEIEFPIFGIEEPLKASDYKGLTDLSKSIDTRIILDESFLNVNDFKKIKENSKQFIINLRISKMGGLIRSIQISEKAAKNRTPIIIGAQVGETSILTRAAITIANFSKENLIAQEGAFGTLLLENDITENSIMFGKRGLIESQALKSDINHGLGLKLNVNYVHMI